MANAGSLAALLKRATLDDHDEVLRAAQAALKSNKKDSSAQIAQIVALLKLDRFQDAIQLFEEGGDSLRQTAQLEYAYALYKTSALDDASELFRKSARKDASLMHMEAQIAYKREDFRKSASIYEALSGEQFADSSAESDLRINLGAVDAQSVWSGQVDTVEKKVAKREDLEQFETAYNAACGQVARGDLRAAQFLLKRAKDLCNAAEDLSEEEQKAEALAIQTQLVCVLCLQGKHEEAARNASNLRPNDVADEVVRTIAQANRLAANDGQVNPYIAQRAFESSRKASVQGQLFQYQKSIILRNAMAIDLQAHKFSRVEKAASESALAGVYAAAAHARNQQGQAAIKELLAVLGRRPADIGLMMTIVQLYVLLDNPQMATSLLERFLLRLERSTAAQDQDTRFSPGLVALTVSLYAGQNRLSTAKLELVKAAKHWRRRVKDEKIPGSLLTAAGAALLEAPAAGDEELALELLSGTTREGVPVDIPTACGLLAARGEQSDATRIQSWALPAIEDLTKDMEVASLEAAGVAQLEKKPIAPATSTKRPAEGEAKSSKPKKIRKSHIPKDYDPNKIPDPERWLPLRERSAWRPKGKKKGKASQGMATQGGIANEEVRPSTPQQQTIQQKPAANAKSKKKNKKGGR